ncbi:MAG TPA: (2Fe-2S)-binding protein [Candidatus Thermoplasmatota archaeon]|nr:(2Fe-2S)-binding protein [Candidatus Thermoplasmatota archaeon]
MTTAKRMVCTCEDVNDVELRDAIRAGCGDLESLKRYTGFGTGPCQGKTCVTLARRLLAEETGADPAALGAITYRAPVQPVPLRMLAGDEEERR